MEQPDLQLEQRVWQRIHGTPDADPVPTLMALAAGVAADGNTFLKLSKQWGGEGGVLLQLSRQEQAQVGCLKGICAMLREEPISISPLPQPVGSTAAMLRRCYANHLQRISQYRRLAQSEDYGPVFEKLLAEEQNHCRQIMELLGKL